MKEMARDGEGGREGERRREGESEREGVRAIAMLIGVTEQQLPRSLCKPSSSEKYQVQPLSDIQPHILRPLTCPSPKTPSPLHRIPHP